MYYAQTFKTKWHDTDACGLMRPSALLVYMQETANLQCRAYNCDLNRLHDEDGMGFLLSRVMVRIDAPLRAYEDIEVRTWCPLSRGLTFLRCFSVLRGGMVVAEAASHWALMDISSRKLMRVSDFHREFPIGDHLNEDTLPRRIRIASTMSMEKVGTRRIVYSDLDFNHHMNNTKYPDMVCDFVPSMQGKWVRTLSLSYLHEAAFGDTLTVLRAPVAESTLAADESYLLRTERADGTVCLEAEIGLCDMENVR